MENMFCNVKSKVVPWESISVKPDGTEIDFFFAYYGKNNTFPVFLCPVWGSMDSGFNIIDHSCALLLTGMN